MHKAIAILSAVVCGVAAFAADNVKLATVAAPDTVGVSPVTNIVSVANVAGNVKLLFAAKPTGTNAVHITLQCADGVAWSNVFAKANYTLSTNAPSAFIELPAASLNVGNKIVIISNANANTPFAASIGYTPKND